eukprot:2023630-Pleurochrysis_carterae.AAC.1
MIVHENQNVLIIAVLCAHERSSNIGVHESSGVRGSVSFPFVGELDGVGFGACRATVEAAGC